MRGLVIDCAALSVLSSSNAGISVKMYTSLATCRLFPEFLINILQEFSRCFVPLLLRRGANEGATPSRRDNYFLRGQSLRRNPRSSPAVYPTRRKPRRVGQPRLRRGKGGPAPEKWGSPANKANNREEAAQFTPPTSTAEIWALLMRGATPATREQPTSATKLCPL